MLLGQASRALTAGAYAGAVLLCRSSLEAACYLFLTRRRSKKDIVTDKPLALDGRLRTVYFNELVNAIKEKRVLSKEQLKNLQRIQRNGNFIAHIAQRQESDVHRLTKNVARRRHDLYHLVIHSHSKITPLPQDIREVRFWIDDNEVLEDLYDSASILQTLSDAL